MSGSSRFYANQLPDLTPGDSSLLDFRSEKLSISARNDMEKTYQKLFCTLERNLTASKGDASIYTGKTGFAYLYLMLGDKEKNPDLLKKGAKLAEESLRHLRKRDVTFLCGDAGPLSVAAVFRHRGGDVDASRECVTAVLDLLPQVLNLDCGLSDELLYGRAGYLYALLFLRKNIPGSVPTSALKQVADAITKSGRKTAIKKKFPGPMLWEWYGEYYIGGAHGYTGILYLLLQVASAIIASGKSSENSPTLMWEWHNKKYVGGAHGVSGILYLLLQMKQELTEDQLSLIQQTVDYLLTLRYSSGNFPSSIGSTDDRLVHWCHGAPGAIQMLLAAYKTWGSDKYLQAAEKCGEVVWNRGLLKKGYGICHGVAGNAYTFLALFQVTRAEIHLHRAVQFAHWCDSFNLNQERVPDRPYSLFEGLAGIVYFLKDIQDPVHAVFPGFSIEPFSPSH